METGHRSLSRKKTPFTDEEMVRIFGEDADKGSVPERGSPHYLSYIKKVLAAKQADVESSEKAIMTQEIESRLRKLSLSQTWTNSRTNGASIIDGIADLSKLGPEPYCLPPKSNDKLTFRELINGCLKVLSYLRISGCVIDGYLAHLIYIMDKASMGCIQLKDWPFMKELLLQK